MVQHKECCRHLIKLPQSCLCIEVLVQMKYLCKFLFLMCVTIIVADSENAKGEFNACEGGKCVLGSGIMQLTFNLVIMSCC